MLALQMYLIEGESCRSSLLQPFEYKSVEVTAITRIRLERSQDGRVVCCHREHAPGCSSPNPRRRYVRVRVPPTVFQNTPPLGPLVSLATAATTSDADPQGSALPGRREHQRLADIEAATAAATSHRLDNHTV